MPTLFQRHPENPIVVPGEFDWRMAAVYNPGVIYEDGRYTLYERAAGQLRPFQCFIGALESEDGVHFRHLRDEPVFTPEMAGSRYGSVQDPRVVTIGGMHYMTYAFRPYAWNSHPTGLGAPESYEPTVPGFSGRPEENMTRSGIAVSTDRVTWEHHSWPTPAELDDRDVILFPEKIGGRFALLRRPLQMVGVPYGTERPSIWLSYSSDLRSWTQPELALKPEFKWEDNRIGGSTPPIRTEAGWLLLYHGVENQNPRVHRVCYRLGGALLDLENPARVVARSRVPLMEPETYYERFGLYIPNVIFPTGAVAAGGILRLYYGVCDTAIALATARLSDVVEFVLANSPG